MIRHGKATLAGPTPSRVGDPGRRGKGFLGLAVLACLAALVVPTSALAAGDANRASCPLETETSPGFRTYLPDCRAYELVTPPFLGGFPPFLAVLPPRRSEFDGGRFLFNSFGTFAGSPGSAFNPSFQGSLYAASREAEGWHTSAAMPPVRFDSQLPGTKARVLVIPSADNSVLAWRMRDTTEPESHISVYLREGSGPFELVGPVTDEPGPTPEGGGEEAPLLGEYAAADLSRIPLAAKTPAAGADKWLWPGDTTVNGKGTLYEYDLSEPGIGTPSSEPKLVGVKNEGRLTSNIEAQLISECGIVLGGGPSRIDRSVSADGKYLYFSAERGCASLVQPLIKEVFARIAGEETVAISNPLPKDCAACLNETTTPTRKAAAEKAKTLQVFFQGASKDGSKVFFTSFQELFPGIFATGSTPNLYRFDFEAPEGERLQLVSKVVSGSAEVQNPAANYTGISADGERAYFLAKGPVKVSPGPLNEKNALGQAPVPGQINIYMWEAPQTQGGEARIAFVATVPINLNPIATDDGRFAIFSTTAQLTPGDTSTVEQLFEYDALSGALVRVSVGDQGFNGNGNTSVNPPTFPFVSADGHRVFFMSSNALAPGALNDPTNTFKNIYEWTWSGSEPKEADARVFLILGAPANGSSIGNKSSNLQGIDPSGDNVYFTTLGKLVPQHTGGQQALYTVRVEGGFPGPAEEPSCEADTCQGLPSAPPEGASLASTALIGPGNATNQRKSTRRRCPSGKRRVRKAGGGTRCAPKQSKSNRLTTKTKRRAGR